MRILFCGDLVGRSGRDVVVEHLPRLRDEWKFDFVVVVARTRRMVSASRRKSAGPFSGRGRLYHRRQSQLG